MEQKLWSKASSNVWATHPCIRAYLNRLLTVYFVLEQWQIYCFCTFKYWKATNLIQCSRNNEGDCFLGSVAQCSLVNGPRGNSTGTAAVKRSRSTKANSQLFTVKWSNWCIAQSQCLQSRCLIWSVFPKVGVMKCSMGGETVPLRPRTECKVLVGGSNIYSLVTFGWCYGMLPKNSQDTYSYFVWESK